MGDLCQGWLTPELTGGITRVMVAAEMEPGTFENPPAQSRSTNSCTQLERDGTKMKKSRTTHWFLADTDSVIAQDFGDG